MIKQSSIDEVRSKADIVEVVGAYTALKRSGSGYAGLCPFHTEKSPSFRVTPAKEIYKCFGCGKSGDVFRMVMEQERKTFNEAVEFLAAKYSITLEYDKQAAAEREEVVNSRKEQLGLMKWAYDKYQECFNALPPDSEAKQYLQQRGYSEERMQYWGFGFAPDGWDFVKTPIINMGKHQPAVDCGLIVSRDGKNYDFYRNRIIIPVHDVNGFVVTLAGRILPSGESGEHKVPKYLNGCESLAYNKKKVWYGLWHAHRAIKEKELVYITEGYMDVQSMQDAGLVNTVASCGTEIDSDQVKMLKRYADHVVLAYDADKTGTEKAMKKINLFLQHDVKVSLVEFPDKMDPDEYVRHLMNEPLNEVIN